MTRNATILKTTFERYTLGPVLGDGGAGRVFVAHDSGGREWAVKLLTAERATAERRKRFKNEINFGVNTRHSNIITITDHGLADTEEGEAPFYVMPRYAGSLREVLKQSLDAQRRLRHFDQILSGIEAAHLQGIVHRDIKPENVLFDSKADCVVVADFGIAHFTDEELYTAAETRSDARLANFQYAAPEQRARGQPINARADIYALGLLLNEFFTGAVPQGTSYRTVADVFPEYSWLDSLVESMLRQDPDRRPGSVEVVKNALIANKQDYVTRQRLDAISKTVVPRSSVTDPLADAPPRIVGIEWAGGQMVLILSQAVNDRWVRALGMGGRHQLHGKGPEAFTFAGNRARVSAAESEVQPIIDYFKGWLPNASQLPAATRARTTGSRGARAAEVACGTGGTRATAAYPQVRETVGRHGWPPLHRKVPRLQVMQHERGDRSLGVQSGR